MRSAQFQMCFENRATGYAKGQLCNDTKDSSLTLKILSLNIKVGIAICYNEEIQNFGFGFVMLETPSRYPSGIVE